MTVREFKFDFLRVVAAFAVIILHTSVIVVQTNPDIHSSVWWVGNIADSYTRWCVPIFVMVSGALMIPRSSEHEISLFYRNRLGRLFIPLLFWTLFYLFLSGYEQLTFDPYLLLKTVIQGQPYYHMWFIYMMVGLYIVTPFLGRFVLLCPERIINFFICICFLIASIDTTVAIFFENTGASFLTLFLPFVGFFIAGYQIKNSSISFPSNFLLIIVLGCGAIISIGTGLVFPLLGLKSLFVMYNYSNPLVIIMSICIFTIVIKNIDFVQNVNSNTFTNIIIFLSPLTFGMYLIHPFFLKILGHFGIDALYIHPFIAIPLVSLVVVISSFLTVYILMLTPYIRSIVK